MAGATQSWSPGKAGARLQAISQSEDARAFDQTVSVAAHLTGAGDSKDAMNLGLLFLDQARTESIVVLLDGFERLHVNRLPGRAGAVDYAADAAF